MSLGPWSSRAPRRVLLALALSALGVGGVGADCNDVDVEAAVPGDPVAIIVPVTELTIPLGGSVVLDGSTSTLGENTDGLGLSLIFSWRLDSRPLLSSAVDESLVPTAPDGATDPSPSLVTFTPDREGLFGVTLQVADVGTGADKGGRLSDRAHVLVTVTSANACPVADAGVDRIGQTHVPITMDGSASTDADVVEGGGDDDSATEDIVQELTHQWHFSLVPADSTLTDGDIYGQGTVAPSFIPDVPGSYILQLRVTDGACESTPDYVTVQVSNGNGQPVAEAGASQLLTPCAPTEVTLDGTGSFDPDGQELSYEWTLTSVPNGSGVVDALIDGRFSATPTFNWDVAGVYTLQLRVGDGTQWSEPDFVAVRAVPAFPNAAPVAVPGDAVVLDAVANCTPPGPYGGSGTCTPCGARSVVVSGTGSYDPDQDPFSYQWNVVSGPASLLGAYSDEVEVELPALGTSYGVTTSSVVTLSLTVYDCRAADDATVTIIFNCDG